MIAVCGEALIDLVGAGRKVPRPGGGPFNTARALARLGVATAFIGRLSTDRFGRQLKRRLIQDGVDISLASFGSEPTTTAIADLDGSGRATYRFVIEGTSAPYLAPEMLPPRLPESVTGLHVGSLGLVFEPSATTLVELIRQDGRGRLVMLDPNVRPGLVAASAEAYRRRLDDVIAMSTVVKGSEEDLAWLYPKLNYMTAVKQLLLMRPGPRLVVVTLGDKGAYGATRATSVQVPAMSVNIVDTIGAGDAFGAALLAWLHDHNKLRADLMLDRVELDAMLGFACLVSAMTCARAGAEPPTRQDIARWQSATEQLGGATR